MVTAQTTELSTLAFIGDSVVGEGDWAQWLEGHTVVCILGDSSGAARGESHQYRSYPFSDYQLGDIAATSPDAVLVQVGTTGLGVRFSAGDLVRSTQSLLVELREAIPHAPVLVHSVLPRTTALARSIRQANIHLRQFCATVHAHYLDLWPALALDDGSIDPTFSPDGVHLSPEGYRAWLEELRPALEALRRASR